MFSIQHISQSLERSTEKVAKRVLWLPVVPALMSMYELMVAHFFDPCLVILFLCKLAVCYLKQLEIGIYLRQKQMLDIKVKALDGMGKIIYFQKSRSAIPRAKSIMTMIASIIVH